MKTERGQLSLTAGRDYNTASRYEYVLQRAVDSNDNWETLARRGGFLNNRAAKAAGHPRRSVLHCGGLSDDRYR